MLKYAKVLKFKMKLFFYNFQSNTPNEILTVQFSSLFVMIMENSIQSQISTQQQTDMFQIVFNSYKLMSENQSFKSKYNFSKELRDLIYSSNFS